MRAVNTVAGACYMLLPCLQCVILRLHKQNWTSNFIANSSGLWRANFKISIVSDRLYVKLPPPLYTNCAVYMEAAWTTEMGAETVLYEQMENCQLFNIERSN